MPASPRRLSTALAGWLIAAAVAAGGAQTRIERDKNKYTPAQDVEIGREAAEEVRREMPLLDDDRVDEYIDGIGRVLVAAIPAEFREAAFVYTFDVINQKEINAFALPGGPMFLNRGMIEAAKVEGEMAGVMAHEIAHVALRHGTAQATKGQRFQIGAIAGQVIGAIVGGAAGSVIAQGSQFGLGAYFLKFGREYEREADLLGARMLARAGYDPRDMAEMFRTIEAQGGQGGPEWLSSHPNPGNRYEAIQKEAATLTIEGTPRSGRDFAAIQSRLKAMPPALTAEQIARAKAKGGRSPDGGAGGGTSPERGDRGRVDPPSSRAQRIRVGNVLLIDVPVNWRQQSSNDSVTFAPDGAWYRGRSGGGGFTHGLQIGVIPNESHSHEEATDELLESLARSNPTLRRGVNAYLREAIGGRRALSMPLRLTSEMTGNPEVVTVTTVLLRDRSLLYLVAVSPADEADRYAGTFTRMKRSIELTDRR